MQYLGAVSKMTEWSQFVCTQHHSNPSLCPNHCCQRSWSWPVLWRPTRPFRTNTKNDVFFIIGDWNEKVGSQEIPEVTGKFGLGVQNEGRKTLLWVLSRVHTSHRKTLPTKQEKTLHMDITKLSVLKSDRLYSLSPKVENLYTVSKSKTGSWLWLRSWAFYWKIQT